MERFLAKILPPPDGKRNYYAFSLRPQGEGGGRGAGEHARAQDPAGAAARALEWSREGRNAWIATGAFNGSDGRKAANVTALRSLWLDLDCERDTAEYPSLAEGLAALEAFGKDASLPEPLLVRSGQGVHAYWPFDEDVDGDAWLWMAGMLATAARKHGLLADPHRTKDKASLMRLPGTTNYGKDGVARPVTLERDSGPYDPAEIAHALNSYAGGTRAVMPLVTAGVGPGDPGPNKQASRRDCDPVALVGECAQVALMGEPGRHRDLWFYCLALLSFCENGLAVAHELSKGDPARYDPEELDRQFKSSGAHGPPLCKTFQGIDPGPCMSCEWSGVVDQPLAAARRAMAAAADPSKPYSDDEFKVVPGKGLYHVMAPEEDGGPPVAHVINDNEFYIDEIQSDMDGDREKRFLMIRTRIAGSPFRTVPFSVDSDSRPGDFVVWLANTGLFPKHRRYVKLMEVFMGSYISLLQRQNKVRERRARFGWTRHLDPGATGPGDAFVVGRRMLTASGDFEVMLSERALAVAKKEYVKSGTLEDWKLVPGMYATLDQKEGQLFVCASFAAPFMARGVGSAKNLILSIWDARGGKGKTTLLQVVNSVWGHPTNLMSTKDDTMSARFQLLALRNNLPFCMDEITTMTDQDLSNMLYQIANGMEKRKSLKGGAGLVDTGTWKTISFFTSNRSIYELMRGYSPQTAAEAMRVVELPCTFESYSRTEAGPYVENCISLMESNYGHAGPAFMLDCLSEPGLMDALEERARDWDQKVRGNAEERFWSYGLGLILEAGRLAARFGYLDYDMDELDSWVRNDLYPQLKARVEGGLESPENSFGVFLNENLANTLVVTHSSRDAMEEENRGMRGPRPSLRDLDPYVKRLPRDRIVMRYELKTRTLYVSVRAFQDWCRKSRVSDTAVLYALRRERVWGGMKKRRVLGQCVPTLPPTSVTCYVFSLAGSEYDPGSGTRG